MGRLCLFPLMYYRHEEKENNGRVRTAFSCAFLRRLRYRPDFEGQQLLFPGPSTVGSSSMTSTRPIDISPGSYSFLLYFR